MPINPQIALGVQPVQVPMPDPNSGMNALARIMQVGSMMDDQRVNALKMREMQRGLDRRNRLDSLLAGHNGTSEELEGSLVRGGFLEEATKLGKDRRETLKLDSERKKAELDMGLKKAEHFSSLLSLAKDPQSYAVIRSLATTQLGQDMPEAYDPNFVSANMALGQTITQRLQEERQRLELALKTANEPFAAGPNGSVPNQAVQDYQLRKAKAGATNVSVSTEKGYAGEMAQGLAKQDLAALDAARSAGERIANAQRVKGILDSQPTITGTGAEARLAFQKALSTAGLIDGQAVKSTEDLASLLASSTLDAIKTSGLGGGQGFTDKDRQFLERAKSGNIEINAGTLRTIADLNEKAARASIDAGAKVAGRLKGNPTFGSVGQDISFTQPPEYKPRGPSVVKKPAASAPAGGVRFLGFE